MTATQVEATFEFNLFVTGLVHWHPRDAHRGAFLGVRTDHHSQGMGRDLLHVASLTYETRALSGFGGRRTAAPDPLVASPIGTMFARRVLDNEILWLEPGFAGAHQPLTVDVPDLLSLRELDPRVAGIREDCLGADLGGTAAVSRLDVDAGRLTVFKSIKNGPWTVRGPDSAASEGEIHSIASILRLTLPDLRSLTIHSNKKPALRFAGEGRVVGSYTVEPLHDSVPPLDDLLPHFEMAFGLATWKDAGKPTRFRKPYLKPDVPFTLGDRACPPSKG